MDFLHVANTPNCNEKKKAEKAFKKKYKVDGRGDFWSGKSRKEKIEQGIPEISTNWQRETLCQYSEIHI